MGTNRSIVPSWLSTLILSPIRGTTFGYTRPPRPPRFISCIMAVEAWWLRHVGNEAAWMDAHPSSAHPCPFVRPRYPITGHAPLPPRLTFLRRYGDEYRDEYRDLARLRDLLCHPAFITADIVSNRGCL